MRHENASKLVRPEALVNIPALVSAYYTNRINSEKSQQRVVFGTSGHRGSSFNNSFNEAHIFAITQALCDYRSAHNIKGKLYMGIDTHALSMPAQQSALQVLVANDVQVVIAKEGGYTPTPVISFTIIEANKTSTGLCDGVVITPSHNPPQDGGFKYNMPHGGPAADDATAQIENGANKYLETNLVGVKKVTVEALQETPLIEEMDFITPYVKKLPEVIDMNVLAHSHLKIGVDPLGGSGIEVYKKINEIYGLNLQIINDRVDPTFSFMSCDHDGKVRMDCSSPDAMASLIAQKDNYDLAFGNDPDFDRHGIVTKTGLINPNHYLSVAIWYLFTHRAGWSSKLKVGKTLVSSSMIDRVAASVNREIYETPVGFKWFVDGLSHHELAFGGEESAGASFLRMDGTPWSTDKDGIILNLLAVEMMVRLKVDPSDLYKVLQAQHGTSYYARIDAAATPQQKAALKSLSAKDITSDTLAGEKIEHVYTEAAGNGAAIGGLKVVTANGWFAARPSGTEDIYKIYAESFISQEHLERIQDDAKAVVLAAIS